MKKPSAARLNRLADATGWEGPVNFAARIVPPGAQDGLAHAGGRRIAAQGVPALTGDS